ncbi:MAG TPA: DUF3572 domain-containing protein [Xanthobacteraceae bacterium]|jgi:hypothetical protein
MNQQPRQKSHAAGRQGGAEQFAIQALGFLAGDPEELGRFLALTGIEPTEIRTAAQQPGFLAGVLDYICAHEPLLLAFARDGGFDPSDIARAREAIAGPPWNRDVP